MTKLLQFQQKVGSIAKDKQNPFFKSNYFDINQIIEEVKPILNELGLVLIQPLSCIYDKPALSTILIDSDTGEKLVEYSIPLPDQQDPQKMGATITYYRRYALQSLLFLQAEDDDGNTASGRGGATQSRKAGATGLKTQNLGSQGISSDGQKKCPYCLKWHDGQYPKCYDCWNEEKVSGIKKQLAAQGVGNSTDVPFEN